MLDSESKGLGIMPLCRLGNGGREDTKTRELSVVRRELNTMFSFVGNEVQRLLTYSSSVISRSLLKL
jgi:hypothetical protein